MENQPFAYIYKITNLTNGRIYIGKKQINFTRKKKITKKAKKISGNNRKRVERVQVDGNWDSYMGSSQELKEDIKTLGIHNFKKEILQTVYNKSAATYYELKWQIQLRVLEKDVLSYNKWISAKVYKNRLLD